MVYLNYILSAIYLYELYLHYKDYYYNDNRNPQVVIEILIISLTVICLLKGAGLWLNYYTQSKRL